MKNYREKRYAIAVNQRDVHGELAQLTHTIRDMFPVGCKVEYLHGDRWIGPCTVVHVDEASSDYLGPDIMVLNDKTKKNPPPLSASRVRHVGEDWNGYRDDWALSREVRR